MISFRRVQKCDLEVIKRSTITELWPGFVICHALLLNKNEMISRSPQMMF